MTAFVPSWRQFWLRALLFVVLWTLIGLSFAGQFYISSSNFGNPVTWSKAVSWALGDWSVWALLSIPVMGLAKRFHFERSTWVRSLGVHAVASAAFALIYMMIRAWIGQLQSRWAGQPVTFTAAFGPLLIKTFQFNLLIYWVILSVSHAIDFYRKYQDHQLRASELEKSLALAKLQALQMQLNPHFLFNTLHAISALMHKDLAAADRMIVRLSDLLRYALESTDAHEVTLKQELEFLQSYLEIEKARFGSRLIIRKDVPEETLQARVPNLVLQPVIENAIRHGIEPHSKPGVIELRASRENGALLLEVRDNGAGLSSETVEEGVGLSNTRARLAELYGKEQSLQLENAAEGGLVVRIRMPFHTAAEENQAWERKGVKADES